MRIAYIISAYKLPDQLIRLVLRLNSPTASFFIHLDKKADDQIYTRLVEGLSHLAHVTFLPRQTCYWGDFGHVRATLEGIIEIIRQKLPVDFVILLTGQDYPIKSKEYIETFLRENRGKSFVDFFPLPSDNWQPDGGLDRIQSWHIRIRHQKFTFPPTKNAPSHTFLNWWMDRTPFLPKRKFPANYQPFGGSSYWCLSRECVEYIYNFIQRQHAYVRFFKYVEVPDEIFFQTILLNSPLRESIINNDLWYIDWKDPDAASPAILDESDFEKLIASPKLFARKFDITIEPRILDMIDQQILRNPLLSAI